MNLSEVIGDTQYKPNAMGAWFQHYRQTAEQINAKKRKKKEAHA